MASSDQHLANLDAELDDLNSPTSAEVYGVSRDYDADVVAASAVGRAITGGGGGSQPITREMFDGLTTGVNPNVSTYLTWTKQFGDELVDLSDPLAPTIIDAGIYAITAMVCAPQTDQGTYIRVDVELDSDDEDADSINMAPLQNDFGGGTGNTVAASVTWYCPAGAVLRVQAIHDIVGGVNIVFKGRLQRLS